MQKGSIGYKFMVSQHMIKWMNEEKLIQDITLQPLGFQLKKNNTRFELLHSHIYTENTMLQLKENFLMESLL